MINWTKMAALAGIGSALVSVVVAIDSIKNKEKIAKITGEAAGRSYYNAEQGYEVNNDGK